MTYTRRVFLMVALALGACAAPFEKPTGAPEQGEVVMPPMGASKYCVEHPEAWLCRK